jgi:hypothetical protein
MTLDELVTRLRSLGFVADHETMGDVTRVVVAKLAATAGNRIEGSRGPCMWDPSARPLPIVDGPTPFIAIEGGRITFAFSYRIPGPPNPYTKQLTSIEDLFAELIHFYFDPDSPMASEPGFVGGGGYSQVPETT